MNIVTIRNGFGGEQDVLDGIPLTDGERVRVEWPDGSVETRRIIIVAKTEATPDETSTATTTKAYVRVPYHGATGRVRLAKVRGVLVERVLAEAPPAEEGAGIADSTPDLGTPAAEGEVEGEGTDEVEGDLPDHLAGDAGLPDPDASAEDDEAAERDPDDVH